MKDRRHGGVRQTRRLGCLAAALLVLCAGAARAEDAAVAVGIDFVCRDRPASYDPSTVEVSIGDKPLRGTLINVAPGMKTLRVHLAQPSWQVKEIRYRDVVGGGGLQVFQPFARDVTRDLMFEPRPSRSAVSSLNITVDTCTVPAVGSGMVRVRLVSSQACTAGDNEAIVVAPQTQVAFGSRAVTTNDKAVAELDLPAGDYVVTAQFKDYLLGQVRQNGLLVRPNESGQIVVRMSDPIQNIEARVFTCEPSGQGKARAVIAELGGSVQLTRRGKTAGVFVGMALRDGDTVRYSGTMVLKWIEGNGEIRFDDPRGSGAFAIHPDGRPSGSQPRAMGSMEFLRGAGSFFFPKGEEVRFKFEASHRSVAVGVKGTRFVFGEDGTDPSFTSIAVTEGVVAVRSLNGAFPPFDVPAGQRVRVNAQGQRAPIPGVGPNPQVERDTQRLGSDYAAFDLSAPDPQQCFERCRGDNSCRAWTYVRPGVQGPTARCYLKNPAPPATSNACCVSGAIPRVIDQQVNVEVDVNRQGADYTSFDLPTGNPDLCFERCRGDARCAAWTFARPGVQGPQARCYLKDSAPPPLANTCCVSGVIVRAASPVTPPPPGAGYRVPPPPPPVTSVQPTPPPAVLNGRVWHELEGTEQAVWTRRPGTSTFDASWSNGRVRAVLELSFWGNQVTIRRIQGTDGYDCTYTGTVEGNLATGTFGCNRFAGQRPWRATIDPPGGAASLPPTAPTGPPAGQPRYLGCFKDPNNPFDLDGRVERSAQNTPQHCIQSCAAQGFRYAGVQYGQSCLCGNSYGRFGQANNCNMRCTGDGNQICGGVNANSVYSTGR